MPDKLLERSPIIDPDENMLLLRMILLINKILVIQHPMRIARRPRKVQNVFIWESTFYIMMHDHKEGLKVS